LAFQAEFLVNNPLDVKIKMMSMSWLCSSPVSPFSVSVSLSFPCTAHALFHERLSNHCQRLRHTFSAICKNLDPVNLSEPSLNHIRPDTRFQTKKDVKFGTFTQLSEILCTDSQDTPVLSSTVTSRYYNWYASTIIYRCIALLQLLYRWQHRSRKLCIPLRTCRVLNTVH
jgi:hypothetical protein